MASSSGRFKRVRQWLQFSRQWHVIDADRQDAHKIGAKVATYLAGRHKPFWHSETDCGDHVVVVNTDKVAMHGFDWKHLFYHFNRGYPKSKKDLMAHEIHDYDPCRIVWMAAAYSLRETFHSSVPRRRCLERLHVLPGNEMPNYLRANLSNQLTQVQPIPRKSIEYTEEERARFPRLVHFPKEHLLDWETPEKEIIAWDPRLPAKGEFNLELDETEENKEEEIC